MLVLTRKENEGVVIETPAGPIRVVILGRRKSKDGTVELRLGFDAPESYKIMREELTFKPPTPQ